MSQLAYDVDQAKRLGIGGNQPPGVIDAAQDTMAALSDWMKDRPVIETAADAEGAKLLLDRAKGCAGELEAERVRLVTPLNEQLAEINGTYKPVHNTDPKKPGTLDTVTLELKGRLGDWIKREEAERLAEAERLRLEAEAVARAAQEAFDRQQEAIDNARNGELGVDVTQVVVEAAGLASQAGKADRAAARAERTTDVKVSGGWGRRASLRTVETLVLQSYGKAIKAIGPNDGIRDAILSAARAYRKEKGSLPEGVVSETTREL